MNHPAGCGEFAKGTYCQFVFTDLSKSIETKLSN